MKITTTSSSIRTSQELKTVTTMPDHDHDAQSRTDSFERTTRARTFTVCAPKYARIENRFIEALDLPSYGNIAKSFIDHYMEFGVPFDDICSFLVPPTEQALVGPKIKNHPYMSEQLKLEAWHEEHAYKFAEELFEADEGTRRRHHAREEYGLGFGGTLSKKTIAVKEAGQFAKKHLMVRSQVVKMTEALCGKSIYEMLPLYASRKRAKIGIIASEGAINSMLSVTGTALAPVSFGISKVVTNQLSTVVTLSGEAVMGKVLGAKDEKIATFAALRGVQLTLPGATPIGSVVQMYEKTMSTGSTLVIASASVADLILRSTSDRYASILSDVDLGDERVLDEINARIDYISRFLLPYGEYLFLRTKRDETKRKLAFIMTGQLRVLRDLEKVKTRALHFYQLAILAERLHPERQDSIEDAVRRSVPDTRKNTHKLARQCLATLLREHPLDTASNTNFRNF